MKQRLSLFGLTGLFWLLFFAVSRILFLIYNSDLAAALTWKDIFIAIGLGLRMDAAMAGYWMILTGLLLTGSCMKTGRYVGILQLIFTAVLLFISCVIVVGDLELYRNWGFRMDTTPLMYAGSEGAGSILPSLVVKLTVIFLLLFSGFFYFFYKNLSPQYFSLRGSSKKSAITLLVATLLLFIPIRSSFTVAPLNTGVVYFHPTIAFANHTGINVVWNFFKAAVSQRKTKYPENFFDKEQAKMLLSEMTKSNSPASKVLSVEKPNILLIILESFTAKIIEPLGGRKGITPQLNKLTKEGILFDDFYASGDRTDKGIISILSAYPAQPLTSIIKFPHKTQGLPYLPRTLQKHNYHTSFVYGGDIGFANMESYVTMAGFSHITEDDDFDSELDESKWGVHDHFVFERLLQECDTAQGPFFKVMLSLSSHEPFDVPLDPPFMPGKDDASLFLNSCYYTDKSLGEFVAQAKTKSWWNNTWVIITADHGHRFPNQEELKEKERFKIPMLWLGGAVTKRDTVVRAFAGQTDIANSVLGQIAEADSNFIFSKKILADPKPFAVYIFHNGFGYIDPENENIYDFDFGGYIKNNGSEENLKWGKAYMQSLFMDYNGR